ncbi:uncharacterized protein LOC118281134 [Spodoptera frugiperda]|uniref:Uncharacterized protein LOC118281134 n=1 Tax=Spodoptera frugiperda TaxID=7108 RepID=A0A9R0DKC3_SPOFR|nr:uncharacterized protein LOC118281134 [Spodoptera frugiperda]
MIVYLRENMKIVILLSLFAYASTAVQEPSPRSVNVALETSFLFEPKDINENLQFVKNVKNFLDKLYSMLAPQVKEYSSSQKPADLQQFRADIHPQTQLESRKLFFIDLYKEFCDFVSNITSNTLEQSLTVIKKEINQILDSNQEILKEIIPDKNIKKILDESYDGAKSNVKYCHKNIAFKKFARKMERMYTQQELKKLQKCLRKLDNAIENNNKSDATRIVREFIQIGIIDKYSQLNVPGRDMFVREMKVLLDYIEVKNKEFKEKHSIKKKNVKPTKEIVYAIDDVTNSSSIENNLETRRSRGDKEKRVGVERSKKDKKRSGFNEIVVDNMELIVQSLKS